MLSNSKKQELKTQYIDNGKVKEGSEWGGQDGQDEGFMATVFVLKDWLLEISTANGNGLKEDIPSALRLVTIPLADKPELIKAYQDRYLSLFSVKIPKQDVIMLFSPSAAELSVRGSGGDCFNDWIWIADQSRFMHREKKRLISKDSFNALCGYFVPDGGSGGKPLATKYVFDHGLIDVVDSMIYLPTDPELIVHVDGMSCLNMFDSRSVVVPAESYSGEGMALIEGIERHIALLMGSDRNVSIFRQWLAWQVQRKGEKALWSPLIQSFEGVGKSFFGFLLECVLGRANVGVISSDQVNSGNNGWAQGHCVNILEELRVQGRNRHEVSNALKPLITNPTIQISDKWLVAYNTRNVTNYIAFTNYKDVLPLNEHDRRWWVVCVDIENMDEFKGMVDYDEQYFSRLFDGVMTLPDEVMKWLMEIEIEPWFENLKQAPSSKDKDDMILSEKEGIDGYVEALDLLRKGDGSEDGFSQGRWNSRCIIAREFFAELADQDVILSRFEKNKLMKSLGFKKHTKRIRLYGSAQWVWTKGRMEDGDIKDLFDKN